MKKVSDSGIYCITNTVNGKVYVGSAVSIKARWRLHLSQLRRRIHHSAHLQASWDKYGEAAFSFSVLEEVTDPKDLLTVEDKWIGNLASSERSRGFNICLKAGSQLGLKHSDATRTKMSAAHKGKVKTAEHQLAINQALKGRSLSEEHRQKIAANQTGRKASEETRQKMREANTDRKSKLSEEAYTRMVTANVGRKFSDEHKARIAEANRRRIVSPETREKISQARRKATALKAAGAL